MRIPVNLANEPFRRDRPMVVASGAVAVLLLLSLMMFGYLAWAERRALGGSPRRRWRK